MHAKALPGFRDFYPDATAVRNHIFAAWRGVARRYGFVEYDGPPLEPLDLYTRKSGPGIVEELYHFVDKGDREVALRPEMTPTLARMVAARARGLKKPIRWFSMPQLFRYERQQRGRLREHFQLNMDLIGEAGPLADAEVIAAALDVQRALGLGPEDVRVRMSDRRVLRVLLADAGVPDEAVPAAFEAIDKVERVPPDTLAKQLGEKWPGASAAGVERVLEVARVRGRAQLERCLGEAREGTDNAAEFLECVEALDHMGLGAFVEIDLSIVRGLAYYTGIVFELFDAQKSLRAICGGGRYDGLLHALGGVDLPGVGFGMGDVVLGELLRERGLSPTAAPGIDAFLVAVTGDDYPAVLGLAHTLRDRGVSVEFGMREQAVAKQLKIAGARPARRAVVIGPEERESGKAIVRDLHSGAEERVTLGSLGTEFAWT